MGFGVVRSLGLIVLLCKFFWHVLDLFIVYVSICCVLILPNRSVFAVLSRTYIFMHTNLYLSLFCWYLDGATFHHDNMGDFYVATLKTFSFIFFDNCWTLLCNKTTHFLMDPPRKTMHILLFSIVL